MTEQQPIQQTPATPAKGKSNRKWVIIGIIAVVVIGVGGWLGYSHVHGNQVVAAQIKEARQLVMFNPLATGPASKKLKAALPKVGETTTDQMLISRVKGKHLDTLIAAAKRELKTTTAAQMSKQGDLLDATTSKLTKLTSDKNFPKDNQAKIDSLQALAKTFKAKGDAVGYNVAVAGLQDIAGETTTYIAAKTKAQKAREAAKAEEAKQLAEAKKKGTYPSLGMLRGDMANGIGVIPMQIMPGGPADNAGFSTDWSDSSVITAIDGQKVSASILGSHSMQSVLQGIPLGKTVTVKFLDGSSTKVHLNLTQNEAAKADYDDLPDPGTDDDTDINFGVDGYNIGQKHNNKEIGLVITAIDSDGSVGGTDLAEGDVICRIDGYYVGTTADVDKILYNYSEGDTVTVDYVTADGHLKSTDVDLTD